MHFLDELLYAPGHDWNAAFLAQLPLLILASNTVGLVGTQANAFDLAQHDALRDPGAHFRLGDPHDE